jgi:hypothetical protein
MKITNVLLLLLLLVVGICIGYYLASRKPKVVVMRFDPAGQMIVGAKAGDQLQWFNGDATPAAVQFEILNPCTNSNDPGNGTCTMKDSGVYPFKCALPGCPDPGVGGGDDAVKGQVKKSITAAGHIDPPYAMPSTVYVYCDATSKAQASGVVTAQTPAPGQPGQAFTIQQAGPLTGFTATFPAGTCDPGDTLNPGSPNCRVKPTVAVNTYSYSITVTGCTNPGAGSLKVM